MSEFVKRQQELKANLVMQIRSVIDGAESESRGLDAAELDKINRIEADIDSSFTFHRSCRQDRRACL